ncbi:MAG: hypothetical protein ACREJN_21785 [Nitrospiraceae bacterium]
MSHEELGRIPQTLSTSPPGTCAHRRMIADCISEEEHEAGQVRCLECGTIIPDPHLHRELKGASPPEPAMPSFTTRARLVPRLKAP